MALINGANDHLFGSSEFTPVDLSAPGNSNSESLKGVERPHGIVDREIKHHSQKVDGMLQHVSLELLRRISVLP